MIGDRWKDIEAGREAGCRTLLIDYGYTEPAGTGRRTIHWSGPRAGSSAREKSLRITINGKGRSHAFLE
jgi:histidinol phosphatase-like enzyme